MPDCVLNSCSIMTSGACEIAFPGQTDLVFGVAPLFSISATELNPLGYT